MLIDIQTPGPRRTLRSVTSGGLGKYIYGRRQNPLTDSLTKPIACGGIFPTD